MADEPAPTPPAIEPVDKALDPKSVPADVKPTGAAPLRPATGSPSAISPATAALRGGGSYGMVPEFSANMTFAEVGSLGLRAWSGWVREEFLPELIGRQGAQKYREMSDNNPVIGAIIYAIKSTMRKVEWRVTPAGAEENKKTSPEAQEAADFVESCMNDMSHSWEDLVDENLSMLTYGYAPHEIVYKRRQGRDPGDDPTNPGQELPKSDYEDNRIGWRRIPIRGQDTILKWFFDPNGQIKGLTQLPWVGPMLDIPIEKMLLFRPTAHKNNPEGRDCTLDTKVRTPSGWTTMGEIKVGDQVYDENGIARNVVGKTEIFKNRPVYEVEFTTGAIVKTGATHRWNVTDYNDRTHGRSPREMTTEQIAAAFDVEMDARTMKLPTKEKWKYRRARSLCCGDAPVLQSPDAALPLDPYILGYWLGDGMTKEARISVQKKDIASLQSELAKAGFDKSHHNGETTLAVPGGFLFALRAAGVLNNKYVPDKYMMASPTQRLALLQGLMDSDGYSPGINSKDEASTFANTNTRLVSAVMELVRSLGGQPRQRILEEVGAMGGVINGHQIVAKQTSYEVRFMLDMPVHRLPRKKHAQVLRRTLRNSGHFIRSVQRVENADTVCIEVDSPSHLFLAGEAMVPTHNSILRTSYLSYYFVKRLQEMEAIVGERLGGIPVLQVPSYVFENAKTDPAAAAALQNYKKIATNVRVDEQMGIVLPSDVWTGANGSASSQKMFEFQLVTPTGRPMGGFTFDQTITRYSTYMMTSVMADFLALGHSSRGTQALSISKVDMFFQAIEGYLNSMAAVYNRHAIPRLFKLNGMDADLQPKLVPDLAQRVDLDVLSNFMLRLSQAGMPLFPNEDLQTYILDAGGLPDVIDENALRAAGLLDEQLQVQDDKDQATLDRMQAPPQPPLGAKGPVAPGRNNLEKMLLASIARRMIRKAGPRYPIHTHNRGRHTRKQMPTAEGT